VARDGPEPAAVRFVMPVDGVVGAQPLELLVRLAVGKGIRRQQVDTNVGAHGRTQFTVDQNCSSISAAPSGSCSIHQCPRSGSRIVRAPDRSAPTTALASERNGSFSGITTAPGER